MIHRSLDPDSEPVFTQLANDPRFSQTAAEFLEPKSHSEYHETGVFATSGGYSAHPDDCMACAPHRTIFLASPAGRILAPRTPREGVVVAHRTPLKGRRPKKRS